MSFSKIKYLILYSLFLILTTCSLTRHVVAQSPTEPIVSTGQFDQLGSATLDSCGILGKKCCEGFTGSEALRSVGPIGDSINKLFVKIGETMTGNIKCAEGEVSTGPFDSEIQKTCASGCCCLSEKVKNVAMLCRDISNSTEKQHCEECSRHGIWTAIGCIDSQFDKFIANTLFGTLLGFAGLAAFICIIISAITIAVSQGNPEKLKNARGRLIACLSGLLLILFSVFLIRLIGGDILRIPEFLR